MQEDVSSIQKQSERTEKCSSAVQRLSDRMDRVQDDVALIVELLQEKKRRH